MKLPTSRSALSIALIATLALAFGTSSSRRAGGAPHKQQTNSDPPIFTWLFQNPTNNNGYEEFVRAADLVKSVDDIDLAAQQGATLEFKRHVLSIPARSTALSLIREGLAKPVKSPRAKYDENTLFPELSLFRKLGKLLATEQYVDFADGRGDAAVESLRVGLAFGYRIQMDTLIAGLVGIAVSTIVSHEFAAHFDQLSIYQCDDVLAFARQMLAADIPGSTIMQEEKSHTLQMLDKRRSDPDGLIGIFADLIDNSDPSDAAALISLKVSLGASPGGTGSIIDAAEAKMSALYDQAAANMRLPMAQRVPLTLDSSNTPAASLCRLVSVDPQRIVDRYTSDQARIRLLAVHVLIRRYQWDHNSLPASLGELHAEDLVVDPFTGSIITYKRDGDKYTLSSAGPLQDTAPGAAQTRNPVTLR